MSKGMDQLSRRLHQFRPPAPCRGTICSLNGQKGANAVADKRCRRLSPTDAAYVAGLIDGEGTITLTPKHRNENRALAVSISSTERPMLDFVKEAVGVGKITNKCTTSSRHTPSFAYAVYNRQALDVLEQVAPFLRSYKSRRCKLILENYLTLTPGNGKYTEKMLADRKLFERAVLKIKSTRLDEESANQGHPVQP